MLARGSRRAAQRGGHHFVLKPRCGILGYKGALDCDLAAGRYANTGLLSSGVDGRCARVPKRVGKDEGGGQSSTRKITTRSHILLSKITVGEPQPCRIVPDNKQ